MNKIKKIICLNILLISLSSCGTIKDGFSLKNKNNSDEFLVEKKSPLVMPPDFDELPVPGETNMNENQNINENEFKSAIKKNKTNISNQNKSKPTSKNFESQILEKINNN